MRQHAFALLVALVVWGAGNIALSHHRAWARSTSIIAGRCEQRTVLLRWLIVDCTIIADECLHGCLGYVTYEGRCAARPGSAMACWEESAWLPVYLVGGPCKWRSSGSCSCDVDDPENVLAKTNTFTVVTVCYEEPYV